MKKLVTAVVVSLILSACASTGKSPAPIESATNTATNTSQNERQGQGQGQGLSQAEVETSKLADQKQELGSQSVYFDFNRSGIKPEYEPIISSQANFLKLHGNAIVTLEGNCDERGSSEYNLALGQRRAYMVSQKLELLGVPVGQIKTVSYGEEKPRLTCHEEKCWKENRRVDFDYNSNS